MVLLPKTNANDLQILGRYCLGRILHFSLNTTHLICLWSLCPQQFKHRPKGDGKEIHRVLHNLILKHDNQFPLIVCGDMNSVTLAEHRGPEPHFCDYDRHNSDLVLLPEANDFSDALETRFPNHGHFTRSGPATTTAKSSTSCLDHFFLNEAAKQLAPRDSIPTGIAHDASCYGTDQRCVFLSAPTLHPPQE